MLQHDDPDVDRLERCAKHLHDGWLEVTLNLDAGTAPWPTPAYLKAWLAPAQPGAAVALAGWARRAVPASLSGPVRAR